MKTTIESLRLIRLEVENFLRVEALRIDAKGNHVIINGQNASGKSSALDAIFWALGGKKTSAFPEPVHQGADRAIARLDLGEYLIEREVNAEGNTRLVVMAADGSKISKPQQLLDGLFGAYALDPVSFPARRDQEQVDDVLGIAGVQPPVGEVMTITGQKHPALAGESADTYLGRLSADETGLYYIRRRDAHRTVTQKEAALVDQRAALEQAGGPIENGESSGSMTVLAERMNELQSQADARRTAQGTAQEARMAVDDVRRRLEGLKADRTKGLQQAEDLARQIEAMQRQLAAQRKSLAEVDQRIVNGQKVLAESEAEAVQAKATLQGMPDPGPAMTLVRQQISQAEQAQKSLVTRRVHQERLNILAGELATAQADHAHEDSLLLQLRVLRRSTLDGVDLGIAELTVSEGQLLYHGVPFRQASRAEQLRVACTVAMRQDPRLKLLRVDDLEHMDDASRRMLYTMANEYDWQIIAAAVSGSGPMRVEIVERT